jgi:3-deoxy-D-manno-octulosonic acid kinase
MRGKWPLGSEVRRKVVTGGAMLYDASRASNLVPAYFDPAHWKANDALEGEARGRGAAIFIKAEGGKHWVLRHYRRGGMIAALSKDKYIWHAEERTRPFMEWQLTYHLYRAGLPVPPPVAAWYQQSGPFYRGDIITERLPNSDSLAACLRIGALSILNWVAIGRVIRRFHDLGVCHVDLNAHNILLGDGDSVYLIDFDRCTLRAPGLWRDGNLVRLRRSLEKIMYSLPPDRFTESDWHGLLGGYREPTLGAQVLQPTA